MDSKELIILAQECYNLMNSIKNNPEEFTHKKILNELYHIQMEILYTAQCTLKEEIKEREKQYASFSCIEMEEDK